MYFWYIFNLVSIKEDEEMVVGVFEGVVMLIMMDVKENSILLMDFFILR